MTRSDIFLKMLDMQVNSSNGKLRFILGVPILFLLLSIIAILPILLIGAFYSFTWAGLLWIIVMGLISIWAGFVPLIILSLGIHRWYIKAEEELFEEGFNK